MTPRDFKAERTVVQNRIVGQPFSAKRFLSTFKSLMEFEAWATEHEYVLAPGLGIYKEILKDFAWVRKNPPGTTLGSRFVDYELIISRRKNGHIQLHIYKMVFEMDETGWFQRNAPSFYPRHLNQESAT